MLKIIFTVILLGCHQIFSFVKYSVNLCYCKLLQGYTNLSSQNCFISQKSWKIASLVIFCYALQYYSFNLYNCKFVPFFRSIASADLINKNALRIWNCQFTILISIISILGKKHHWDLLAFKRRSILSNLSNKKNHLVLFHKESSFSLRKYYSCTELISWYLHR